MIKMKYTLMLIMLLSISYGLKAQLEEGQTVDKIVAVVGKEIILKSEIDARLYQMKSTNPSVSVDDQELRDKLLNSIIDEKLIITKALEDSVEVKPEEIDQQWNSMLGTWIAQFGSQERIEKIFKMPLSRIKFQYKDQIRNQILTQKINFQKFGQINVSPREVREFYEEFKDSLQMVPDEYEIAHIKLDVKIDNTAKEVAYKKAMAIRDSLIKGEDFAELASRNSEDFGTSNSGGDQGWFEKGRLFPEFEKAAFALQVDETSLPVETPFGYHIIQTIAKEENKINTRHILVKFGEKNSNREEVLEKLNDFKKRCESGESLFEELAKKYSDDNKTRGFGGSMGKLSLGELPVNVRTVVGNMKESEISEPLPYGNDPTKPAFHIVYFKKLYPQHEVDLEKDFNRIESIAKNYKQSTLLKEWIAELKEELYWEIKK